MIRLFTGFDARESIGWGVFAHSVVTRASLPVCLIPLSGQQMDGSTAFTYVRFLIPKMCGYEGWAIFADGCDMLCQADLAELWALRDERYAVQVVKHEYVPQDPIKYKGTSMECRNVAYPRKNWSSLTIWNCAHPSHYPAISGASLTLHQFQWLKDHEIGSLPIEWNWLCDEYGENTDAKLLHWTTGIPAFAAYRDTPMAEHWFTAHLRSCEGLQLPVKEVV